MQAIARRCGVLFTAVVALVSMSATPASAQILSGRHQIMTLSWGVCLDVTGALPYENALVGVETCVNGLNQRWQRLDPGNPTRLQVQHSLKCLGVDWIGNGYWSRIMQQDCSRATFWTIVDYADGWSAIRTVPPSAPDRPSRMCLEKYGSIVHMWDCHLPPWQQWQTLG